MPEAKDSAIKLFGKTIQLASKDDFLSEPHAADVVVVDCQQSSNGSVSAKSLYDENAEAGGPVDSKLEDGSSSAILEEFDEDLAESSTVSGNPQTPSEDKESSFLKSPENEEQNGISRSHEKLLNKPDKILPCPRCNSMDTKFCYLNNYNVNQPRHFCKNCQRYWTAGGTMRNMPVGAGRRKNKNSSSHNRHVLVPGPFQDLSDTSNGITHPAVRANAFGLDVPLCESVASTLTIAEKSSLGTNGCSNATSNTTDKGVNQYSPESSTSSFHSCASWPNPRNPDERSSAVLPHPFLPSGFPVTFYPTPRWGGRVSASCNMPCMSLPSASADRFVTSSSPNFPLGKHKRDGNMLKSSNKEQHDKENRTETNVFVPKTLRIDDTYEALRSPIWTTLGLKNEKTVYVSSGFFFRGFRSKGDEMNSTAEASLVLQANPAALSRSLTFRESAE